MSEEKDPGIRGKKLSKSDGDKKIEERNKSYMRVLNAEISWIQEYQKHRKWVYYDCNCKEIITGKLDQSWCICGISLLDWMKESKRHEQQYGW